MTATYAEALTAEQRAEIVRRVDIAAEVSAVAQRQSAGAVADAYVPRGAAAELFEAHDNEILLAGPAGTGKSRACFEYIHRMLMEHPRSRALVVRKTLSSLTASGLVTFREKVIGNAKNPHFFGGSPDKPAQYEYSNGSVMVVGGMDNPQKTLSTEYDIIYVQEATELELNDWEMLTRALRNGMMPVQQMIADCNPAMPSHWLLQRSQVGTLRMLLSRHEDNPVYWDVEANDWTEAGRKYVLGTLERLTGVRLERLRYGRWAAAEGVIYDGWDQRLHVIDQFSVPLEWPRYWIIDFGFTNPFCLQCWAEDPDGRLILYRELYRTQRLVEDHCEDILDIVAPKNHDGTRGWCEPKPKLIICDHDAEDRATFERKIGLRTTEARKNVSAGIQSVASRLKPAGDGKPRLLLMRDVLVQLDAERREAGRPTCTAEEVESYVWDTSNNRKKGEEPLKKDDHGMDCMRYLVFYLDGGPRAQRKI